MSTETIPAVSRRQATIAATAFLNGSLKRSVQRGSPTPLQAPYGPIGWRHLNPAQRFVHLRTAMVAQFVADQAITDPVPPAPVVAKVDPLTLASAPRLTVACGNVECAKRVAAHGRKPQLRYCGEHKARGTRPVRPKRTDADRAMDALLRVFRGDA